MFACSLCKKWCSKLHDSVLYLHQRRDANLCRGRAQGTLTNQQLKGHFTRPRNTMPQHNAGCQTFDSAPSSLPVAHAVSGPGAFDTASVGVWLLGNLVSESNLRIGRYSKLHELVSKLHRRCSKRDDGVSGRPNPRHLDESAVEVSFHTAKKHYAAVQRWVSNV